MKASLLRIVRDPLTTFLLIGAFAVAARFLVQEFKRHANTVALKPLNAETVGGFRRSQWYSLISGGHAFGSRFAPVTIIEFGDYTCRACADVESAFEWIAERWPDHVLRVYRHYSRDSLGRILAAAAECIGDGKAFADFHASLYGAHAASRIRDVERMTRLVRNTADSGFQRCVLSDSIAKRITEYDALVRQLGDGTPPLLLLNGRRISSVIPRDSLIALVKAELGRNHDTRTATLMATLAGDR